VSPARKREAVVKLRDQFATSERRACRVLDQPRSSQRRRSRPRSDEAALVKRMLELVRKHPRYGYRMITAKLRQAGWRVNAKRIYRLWRKEGLKVPKKKRKRRRLGSSENACHRRRAEHKDHVWCWDFIFDRTESGSPLKWLSIEDEYTRECLCLKVDRSITSEDVIDTLAELFAMRGVPEHVRSDNGPEFIARAIRQWLEQLEVKTLYIDPGAPWENGYAESFHSRFRDEFLASEVFENLAAARELTTAWKENYTHHRPHSSLGYLTPTQFAARCTASAPKSHSATPNAPSPLQQCSGTNPVLS
jgi:transposase InsO family protein